MVWRRTTTSPNKLLKLAGSHGVECSLYLKKTNRRVSLNLPAKRTKGKHKDTDDAIKTTNRGKVQSLYFSTVVTSLC